MQKMEWKRFRGKGKRKHESIGTMRDHPTVPERLGAVRELLSDAGDLGRPKSVPGAPDDPNSIAAMFAEAAGNQVNPGEHGVLATIYKHRDRTGATPSEHLTKFQLELVPGLIKRHLVRRAGPEWYGLTDKGEAAMNEYRGS